MRLWYSAEIKFRSLPRASSVAGSRPRAGVTEWAGRPLTSCRHDSVTRRMHCHHTEPLHARILLYAGIRMNVHASELQLRNASTLLPAALGSVRRYDSVSGDLVGRSRRHRSQAPVGYSTVPRGLPGTRARSQRLGRATSPVVSSQLFPVGQFGLPGGNRSRPWADAPPRRFTSRTAGGLR